MALKPSDLEQIEASMERAVLRAFGRVGISMADDDKTDAWRRRFDYLKDQADSSDWLQRYVRRNGRLAGLLAVCVAAVILVRAAPVEWLQRLAELFTGGR